MKTIDYFKIPSLLLLLSLGGKAMEARDSSPEFIAPKKRTGTWLTITKVKKPWYAWRSLVSSRMEKSIPEYKAIPGLDEKFYSFLEGSNRFGGIYIWDKKADAEAWFLPSWFARIEKQYGERGVVDSYSILSTQEIEPIPSTGESLYAIISYRRLDPAIDLISKVGLLQFVELKDSEQKPCHLTLWKNQESALSYFQASEKDQMFFIPVFFRK
ncbi:hypothetical protein LPTSP4_25080 [Leptospira ryugenii]|uniref:Uncharacterized protein n=1 Tax=Leptospira ryugenii TaxID=1917863 RepID=A0A2P2E254_9LEPT|nr:hypothetical protein [Leptospira ryugenii]GBF50977.1 hypothetical protein LPTSP4_25080 [Leptospira ryugenii]